jgi:hypothetical protein
MPTRTDIQDRDSGQYELFTTVDKKNRVADPHHFQLSKENILFFPSWIRIRIPNPDPDPLARLNPDPIRIRIRNPAFKGDGWRSW